MGEDHPTGYRHPDYAASLAEFGAAHTLPRSRGHILCRTIAGGSDRDAMGCYPLLACGDWSRLGEDLEELAAATDENDGVPSLVSLTAVTDPLAPCDRELLVRCFPDLCVPFKRHFVIDTSEPMKHAVSAHHRRMARRALRRVRVQQCTTPVEFLDDWMALHAHLSERHDMAGIRAFSRQSFARQLALPGMTVLQALSDERTIGAQLWLEHDGVAYGHVMALGEDGYRLGAGYALYWSAIEHFRGRVQWCDIGAAPGGLSNAQNGRNSGLSEFKSGWATDTRTAYLCGRVLDRARFDTLVERSGARNVDYFPPYRAGEFVEQAAAAEKSSAT